MRILIVRLSSLGDIVHAIPVAAALRDAFPTARIDWLVETRFSPMLDLIPIIDRKVVVDFQTCIGHHSVVSVTRTLRASQYDCVLDVQGLYKSALLARLSNARRVIGFSSNHVRERWAAMLYTERHTPLDSGHRIQKNLSLLTALDVYERIPHFPIASVRSELPQLNRSSLGISKNDPFAAVCPGSSWPNKRWPPERFGRLAQLLFERFSLRSTILRGPGEESLAHMVAASSQGAARVSPPTSIRDVVAIMREASLVVACDSGPMHIAAAVGTPVVSIHGPTDPEAHGPWSQCSSAISRYRSCQCQYQRRCSAPFWCLNTITAEEVLSAAGHRLSGKTTKMQLPGTSLP